MFDYTINIAGSEWIIIIFVALILILGTGKLPNVSRKFGRIIGEYNKAKNEIQDSMKNVGEKASNVSGPVETEQEKLETTAKSIGINVDGKTSDEIRKAISEKIGHKEI